MSKYTDLPRDGDMFYGYGDKYTISIHNLRVNEYDFDLSHYPIWNESYRQFLNLAILDWFDPYEIGFETPAQFKRALNAKMALIMPKYNVMFKSRNLTEHPLKDHDYTVERTEQGTLDSAIADAQHKSSNEVTDDDYTRNKDNTLDTSRNNQYNRSDRQVVDEDKAKARTDNIGNTKTNVENKSSNTTGTNSSNDNRKDFARSDSIDRFSNTPQQSIDNLGEAGTYTENPFDDERDRPYPNENDEEHPSENHVAEPHRWYDTTVFNPAWIDKWLTTADLVNQRNKSEYDLAHVGEDAENYAHNVSSNGTSNTTETENTTEDNTKTSNLTRGDTLAEAIHTGENEQITDGRDINKDYVHDITDNKTIDTDTTRHYLDEYTGRKLSEQELATKLYETAYDIEMLIIHDLEPLFFGLYDN